jgi:hypothetical protein
MVSSCGVIKGKSKAGDQLIKQEFGGSIKNREFIPTKEARVSQSPKRVVSKRYYLKNIKPKKGKKIHQNQEFIKAAFKVGKGGFVRYNNILFEIRVLRKPSRNSIFIKTKPVYSVKPGRTIKLKARPFLLPAGKKSANKMGHFYFKNAESRFKKYL